MNSVWYMADKGGRAVLNLVLFAAVSRSLGPEALCIPPVIRKQ